MDKLKTLSELALIRALPDFIVDKLKPGRLKNKCDRLIKIVDSDIQKIPTITIEDAKKVKERVDLFGKKTGWANKERHIITLISFHMAMIEDSHFSFNPKIQELLFDIFDYFERYEGIKGICCVSGGIALEKWRMINE